MAITSPLNIYETLNKEIDALTKVIDEAAERNEDVQRLTLISGVGSLVALYFVVTIEDPNRFKDPKNVGAYFGLTPLQYSSGELDKMMGISKRGDKTMRSLLYEAATVILYRTKKKSSLKEWGHKLEKKIGSKKARVGMGRKLAIMMVEVFKTKQPFVEPPKKPKRKREKQVLKPLTAMCVIR